MDLLRALVKSPGWALLDRILSDQMRLRKRDITTRPLTDLDSTFALTYAQGELAGVRLARELPAILVEDLENEIDARRDTDGSDI